MTRVRVLTAIVVAGLGAAGVAAGERGGGRARGFLAHPGLSRRFRYNLVQYSGAGSSNHRVRDRWLASSLLIPSSPRNGEAITERRRRPSLTSG